STASQIFAFGDNANADHVSMLWDVPKPSFFRYIGNGGCAFIDARVALCALVVSPHGNFVKIRIANAPIVATRCKSFLTGAIQSYRGAIFDRLAVLCLAANAEDSIAFLN